MEAVSGAVIPSEMAVVIWLASDSAKIQVRSAAGGEVGRRRRRRWKASFHWGAEMSTDANNWEWLKNTYWYVPEQNLLAIRSDPETGQIEQVYDQTVFQITNFLGGYFWGKVVVQLMTGTGSSPAAADPPVMCFQLVGSVTPEGSLYLSFSPTPTSHRSRQQNNTPTVGAGVMRLKDDKWTMELQMASGTSQVVSHWAYMAQCASGEDCMQQLPGVGISLQDFLNECKG